MAIKGSPGIKHALGLIQNSDINTLQKIFISLHIFKLGGWSINAELMHELCKKLNFEERYFVCDKDAIVKNEGFTQGNVWLGEPYKQMISSAEDIKDKRERLKKECKVFFWRHGTIEDMAISLLRSKPDEESLEESSGERRYDKKVFWKEKSEKISMLEGLNVILPYDRWMKPRKQKEDKAEKLYLQQKVTWENIEESLEIFLFACDDETDDLIQFLQFLLDANGQTGRVKEQTEISADTRP